MEDLGLADQDPGPGGGRPKGIQYVLQGGSSGGVALGVGAVGPDPYMEFSLGSFQHRVTRRITRIQLRKWWGGGMVVSISDVRYGGGRIRKDRGLDPKEAEYGCAIYFDLTNYGPL